MNGPLLKLRNGGAKGLLFKTKSYMNPSLLHRRPKDDNKSNEVQKKIVDLT